MVLAVIDTQILSYANTETPSAEGEFIQLSLDFFDYLSHKKYEIIIPSIVIGELLVAIPEDKQKQELSKLSQLYRIVPYDIMCGAKFAELTRNKLIKTRRKDILQSNDPYVTKHLVKADVMIMATAIRYGATVIFSDDRDMKKLAQGFIDVKTMRDVSFQLSLEGFRNED